jgi:tol-pal system protein YbgF
MVAGALLLPAGPVLAQDTRELMNRIDRLQRELSTLQQDYYRNRGAQSGAAVGAGVGSATAASFEVRLSQIESQLQALTGRAEELSHANDLVKDRLDKLVSDVDSRLLAVEQQRGGSAQAAPQQQQQQQASAPPAAGAAQTPRGQAPAQPGQPGSPSRGTPPANLGTLPPDAAAAIKPPLPDGNAKQQYDYATALITKDQNFPEAERALRAFIAAYPTDGLTPNAYYWLGETYYVRKDYQQAAFTFAEAFQKYPKAQKAPDSLFKLGLSLSQLNQTKEACTAYGRLLDNFPTADNALKARVGNEQRRLKCV